MIERLSLAQSALLELIKISFGKSKNDFDFSVLSADDWSAVVDESKVSSVALICFDATTSVREYIPQDIYNRWFSLATKTLLNNSAVNASQAELIKILNENKIEYIILKGQASASYYPSPDNRTLGDVDFIVAEKDLAVTEDKLVEAGYSVELEEHERHKVFKKPKAHLEMHYEVAGIPEGKKGCIVRKHLKSAETRYTNENGFNNPLPELHGLIILLHSAHHLVGEGLGLRHLCDWACFVDKTCNDSFWSDSFLPSIRECGLLEFAAVLTKTSAIYLGTCCPSFAERVDDSLCADLIEDMLALGNFGKKDKARSIGGGMLSKKGKQNSKFVALFKTVCGSVHYMYPVTKKYPILFPFMFVFRVLKYFFAMLTGKKPSLIRASALANERKNIYNQLKLFDTEEEK